MKKIVFVFGLLFAMGFSSFGQNVTDGKGLKQGLWKEETKDVVTAGFYVNDKKDGAWTIIKKDLISNITNWKNGEKNGIEVIFDNRGQVIEQKWFKNDALDGRNLKYKNGRVVSDVTYEKGLEEGRKTVYYDNGKVQEESNWIKGVKNGVSKWFDDKGVLIAEYNYKFGNMDGIQKGFYASGEPRTEDSYVNGVRTGTYKEFYTNGTVKVIGNYTNDHKTGEWITYDENGMKIKSEKF